MGIRLVLRPHLPVLLLLSLVVAVAGTYLVAVAPPGPAAGVLLFAGRAAASPPRTHGRGHAPPAGRTVQRPARTHHPTRPPDGTLAPALAAGCTVVLKPSPYTPLSSLRFGQLVADALPPGVLNIVSGSDSLGSLMTGHPLVRMISFTGSVATGKAIAATAATDLKRVLLELGGNDPAIVLDDADVNATADGLFANAFANCGQICVAIKRVYAPKALYGQLVDALADRARASRLGDGRDSGTDIGPLCNPVQRDRIKELVGDALQSGIRVAVGGSVTDGPGYFYEPTILAGLNGSERIVVEEQFGPALPIIEYSDIEEAIAQANDSNYGLGASVWTTDPERGRTLAPRVESGTVWVNTHQSGIPGQPFGGLKWSGIGVEGGPWGMLAYTELQAIHANRV
jgi:acyl-CoA reductase-like NAD-dependent aldehyde dehydrogenase